MIRSFTAALTLGLSASAAVHGIAEAQTPEAASAPTIVKLPGESSRFCFRDLDGDQHLDLVLVKRAGVQVSFQRPDGSYPVKSDADLAWPSGKLGWDLADADGDGSTDLILLDESGDLKFHRIADRSFQPAAPLLTGTRAFLPAGIRRLRCVRDVDGDGQTDVVIPGTGRYRVFLTEVRDGERSFRAPIEVEFDANIDLGVGDPDELDSRFSSEVWLPWFDLRDVDGDGDADLLAETDDEVFFYLAEPGLPDRPTWTLALDERRRALEQGKRGIDFNDLLSNVAPTVSWRIEDLDGVIPNELILQEGSTLKIYSGGSRNGVDRAPDQLLRASGTILYFFLRDALGGDGRPELQIVRSEALSIAKIVRWLVLPGSFDIDLYTYANDGGAFGRKPAKKTTLALRFPRLLSLQERAEEIEETMEVREAVPAVAIDLDGDGLLNDILDLQNNEIVVFRDALLDEEAAREFDFEHDGLDGVLEHFLLEDLDRLEDGEKMEFGLDQISQLRISAGAMLREWTEESEPALRQPAALSTKAKAQFLLADRNGDGRKDIHLMQYDEDDRPVLTIVNL